jgi:Arm DNA-binding domain
MLDRCDAKGCRRADRSGRQAPGPSGRQAERAVFGLGGFPAVTLSQAPDNAREARVTIEDGIDPVEERKAAKAALVAAQRRGLSFADALDRCLASKLDAFKNPEHR